jgi:Glycosyltransferase Family 4
MRVAIVHYWLASMRGGEKVVESLCRLFPEADIFTHVCDPEKISETIRRHRIFTTFINSLPRARRYYKHYLPLMPLALEQIDLRGYDLIISSESGPAKGIIPPPGAVHLCYCHSPMYIWNMFHDYRERTGWLRRVMMPPLCHYLRIWDATASMRLDRFVANSATVAARIEKYSRRDATVIYPQSMWSFSRALRPAKLKIITSWQANSLPIKDRNLPSMLLTRLAAVSS